MLAGGCGVGQAGRRHPLLPHSPSNRAACLLSLPRLDCENSPMLCPHNCGSGMRLTAAPAASGHANFGRSVSSGKCRRASSNPPQLNQAQRDPGWGWGAASSSRGPVPVVPCTSPASPSSQIVRGSPEAQLGFPATDPLSTNGVRPEGSQRRGREPLCACPRAFAPVCTPPGTPTSLMKSAMSAGLVGSMRGGWGRTRPNGASRRSGGRPRGAHKAASSVGWRSWLMS